MRDPEALADAILLTEKDRPFRLLPPEDLVGTLCGE